MLTAASFWFGLPLALNAGPLTPELALSCLSQGWELSEELWFSWVEESQRFVLDWHIPPGEGALEDSCRLTLVRPNQQVDYLNLALPCLPIPGFTEIKPKPEPIWAARSFSFSLPKGRRLKFSLDQALTQLAVQSYELCR